VNASIVSSNNKSMAACYPAGCVRHILKCAVAVVEQTTLARRCFCSTAQLASSFSIRIWIRSRMLVVATALLHRLFSRLLRVCMHQNLNFESRDPNPFEFIIRLQDSAVPPAINVVPFTLYIDNRNDVPTLWSVDTISVEENATPNRVLMDVEVSDEDEVARGDTAEYSIVGGDPKGEFRIEAGRGLLYMTRFAAWPSSVLFAVAL
jgi:hypothetical protein